jgi:tRNA A-37 threonylcarbamoyl transferase component Bud32
MFFSILNAFGQKWIRIVIAKCKMDKKDANAELDEELRKNRVYHESDLEFLPQDAQQL